MSESQREDTARVGAGVRQFVGDDLRAARFVRCDLRDAVMRGVDIAGADIDAPWLLDGESRLIVNGVDVAPFVDAELNRRYPGREQRHADSPVGLRSAWTKVEQAWAIAVGRAQAMPAGTVDESVDGEWSFAQTLRHLVMATDMWLRRAIQEVEEPFHPIGQPNIEYEAEGNDMSIFVTGTPSSEEVLRVRAERMAMVKRFLDGVSAKELQTVRRNPWFPEYPETTLSCLHTILEEEWEHLRYAERDLDVLAARGSGSRAS